MQLDGFIAKGQEHIVCKLHRSIFELKQVSQSWNILFNKEIKYFNFEQNTDKPCVYKKCKRGMVLFLYEDEFSSLRMM